MAEDAADDDYRAASPLFTVGAHTVPTVFFHGTADAMIPLLPAPAPPVASSANAIVDAPKMASAAEALAIVNFLTRFIVFLLLALFAPALPSPLIFFLSTHGLPLGWFWNRRPQ